MFTPRREKAMSQETSNIIEHNGEKVFFEVSPCSWMNKGYGLQVQISVKANPVNAESEFIRDKAIEATERTKQELEDAAKVMVTEWLGANGTALLHDNVAKWQAARAEFARDLQKEEERFAAKQAKDDKKYKAKGYTHRVDAVIHPTSGGDDYMTSTYYAGKPTEKDIAKLLRSSEVKDDYKVTEL